MPVHDWTYDFEGIQRLSATPVSQVEAGQDILGVIPAPDEEQDFMLSRLAADEPLAIIDQSQIADGGEQPLLSVQGVPTANLGAHHESDVLGTIKTPSEESVPNTDFDSNKAAGEAEQARQQADAAAERAAAQEVAGWCPTMVEKRRACTPIDASYAVVVAESSIISRRRRVGELAA